MPPVHEDYRVLHGFVKIPSIGQAKTGKNPAIPRVGDRVIGQSSGSTCKRGKNISQNGGSAMRRSAFACALLATVAFVGARLANDSVIKLTSDPNNWAMQSGNYASTRYSTLDQITTENVSELKVAWTFSTGVLRGHEGGPLVIGDMMYAPHAVPEHRVRSEPRRRAQDHLEVRAQAGSVGYPGHVLRHGQPWSCRMPTARSSCTRPTRRSSPSTPRPARNFGRSSNGDPKKGETGTRRPACRQG